MTCHMVCRRFLVTEYLLPLSTYTAGRDFYCQQVKSLRRPLGEKCVEIYLLIIIIGHMGKKWLFTLSKTAESFVCSVKWEASVSLCLWSERSDLRTLHLAPQGKAASACSGVPTGPSALPPVVNQAEQQGHNSTRTTPLSFFSSGRYFMKEMMMLGT